MLKWLDRLRVRHILRRYPIPHDVWEALMHRGDIFGGLTAVERAHLRELTTLFLHRKTFNGVQGLTVTTEMAVTVSAIACLLVLKLDLDYYDGWVEVVLYPAAFRVERESIDQVGLVSHEAQALSGESWSRGAVILSWDDVAFGLVHRQAGHNVVVHEFAHKLDMLNGSANGMPALHRDMDWQQWTVTFSAAFADLQQRLHHHHKPAIDAYGATSPAEFFAVVSEYFFTNPQQLYDHYPEVYSQLARFYRQETLRRRVARAS